MIVLAHNEKICPSNSDSSHESESTTTTILPYEILALPLAS